MATQAEQSNNPVAVIRQNLTAMAPEFKAALPPHIPVEKFSRVAMTAIQANPDLATKADRRSLFGAFVKLAQDGLLPDGREAAVVMFGNKAQAMPMIAGILKRIRQSGEVARVSAHVVYGNDTFIVRYGFDEDVEHVPPALNEPRGEPIGAYATAVLKDGSKLLEVMSLEQIEKVRKVSRASGNGPWVAWWDEMARKTVMRRLSKRLPMSTDLEEQIFSRDDTLASNLQPAEPIELQANAPPVSRLDAIESQIADQGDYNTNGDDQQRTDDQVDTGPHPAVAIADRIIGEMSAANAVIDINSIHSRHRADLEAMPEDIASTVDAAKARLIKAIEKQRSPEPVA